MSMRCERPAQHSPAIGRDHFCSDWKSVFVQQPDRSRLRSVIRVLLTFAVISLLSLESGAQAADHPFLGVTLRNSLLERRFSRKRSEEEPVSTSLLNSSVTGRQSTVTETRLRIVPDPNLIRFELLNSGDVTSQTTGINRQALVDSSGHHHFDVIKPMSFDGRIFLTLPCHGTIQASQTPNRVVSAAGAAIPLLSQFGDRVAWNEVMRRQPQINRAVAEDVARDVLPKIDTAIDKEFAKLGREWESLRRQTNAAVGGMPLRWSARSTETTVALWTDSVPTADSSSRSPVISEPTTLGDHEEIVMFVSEEAVAALLLRHVPKGLRITDSQMQKLQPATSDNDVEPLTVRSLLKLAAELRTGESGEAALFTLEFAQEKPFEVRFVDGDVRVISTFQIHLKTGSSSGWMTTSFNLRGKGLPDDRWTVAVRNVEVGESSSAESGIAAERVDESPAMFVIPSEPDNRNDSPQDDSGQPVVTTVESGTVWMTVVRSAAESLAEKLPPVRLPLEFDGSEFAPGLPRLRLSRIESAGGMLRVSLRIAERRPVASTRN